MKIIIDIPEEVYKDLMQTGENTINLGELLDLRNSVRNGTPLDNVTSRISELRDSWKTDGYEDEAEALNVALRYIDEEVRKHDRTDHI